MTMSEAAQPAVGGAGQSITRVSFVAGATGEWLVRGVRAIVGEPLPMTAALSRLEGATFVEPGVSGGPGLSAPTPIWVLRAVRSNERYIERAEKTHLGAVQEGLGRPASRAAAL